MSTRLPGGCCASSTDGGQGRLVGLVQTVPVHVLAQTHLFVPYEGVRSATVHRVSPVQATIEMHDGTELELKERWSGEYLTKDSQQVLVGHLHSLTAVRHPQGTGG